MRSLKSGLLGCIVAGLLGTFAVVGCSASGDTGDFGDLSTETDPTEGDSTGTTLPPSNPDDDDDDNTSSKADAGKKDAGKDAGKGKDAGPPPPDSGTACATANQIFKRTCGTCGTQEAVCLANSDGSSGGTVSDYGECKNQVVDGCLPGTTEDVACGNCGTQKRTCNAFCAWSAGSCTGQPASSCTPGSVELLSAGCEANKYRQKTCKATCTWDNISASCTAPPTFVLVPPTAGSVSSTVAILSESKTIARVPSGTCPLTGTFSTSVTPYAYIEVRNTNAKAAKVSIYNSQATGGPVIDTVMAAYSGTAIPTSETARKACTGAVNDYGNSTLTGDGAFASLDGTRAVTIPANSSVQVYFAAYYAYDASDPSESTGMIKLNVKTESLAP